MAANDDDWGYDDSSRKDREDQLWESYRERRDSPPSGGGCLVASIFIVTGILVSGTLLVQGIAKIVWT